MAFSTKITRARFVLGPFTTEQMQGIGEAAASSIIKRIKSGQNVLDVPAKPLKPGRNGRRGYPDYKIARGLQPIRDWTWSGRTLRSLKVLSANENRVVIGFTDDRTDRVAHSNNLREKMFGVSPTDMANVKAAVVKALKQGNVVKFAQVA